TTQDPISFMGKLRQAVYALQEPTAKSVVAGNGGSGFLEWDGTYDGPIFQSGDSPYLHDGGQILVDASGNPRLDHMEEVRFAVTVPSSGAMPGAGWPIVLYAHGTGGDYRSFIREGIAARLAGLGLATISIDQVLHGPRDPTGMDPEYTFFNFQNP